MENIQEILQVQGVCYERYPCMHHVKVLHNDGSIKTKQFNGMEIVEFIKNGLWKPCDYHKHFSYLMKTQILVE